MCFVLSKARKFWIQKCFKPWEVCQCGWLTSLTHLQQSTVVQLICERQFLWSTESGSLILLIQLASQPLNHAMAQSFICWLTMTHRP